MRAWMDDEQPVVQQLQILRCLRFVEFTGQGLIKEVQPPDSPEVLVLYRKRAGSSMFRNSRHAARRAFDTAT